MATVTGYTAARTQAIEDSNIIGGAIDGSGHLILEAHDGSTVDAGYMLASIPDATTTHTGVVELATNAEGIAGTDTVRAITPAVAKAILDDLRAAGIIFTVAATSTDAVSIKVTGDTQKRFVVNGDGKIEWGSGALAADTDLYRVAAGTLQTDGALRSSVGGTGAGSFATIIPGDVANRFLITGDGGMSWGSGAGARDTQLFRSGGGRLKNNDEFEVGGRLYLGGLSHGQGNKLAVAGFTGSASTSGSTAAGSVSALNTSVSIGTNSMILVNGEIYMVVVTYQLSDNINSSYSMTIPRIYTSGGSVLNGWVHYNGFNGHLGISYSQVFYIKRIAGTNLTTGFGWTIQRYISGIAGSSFLDTASVTVNHTGSVFDHADLAALAVAV